MKLLSNQEKALAFLKEHKKANSLDIAKAIHNDKYVARNTMDRLIAKGLVRKEKSFGIVGDGWQRRNMPMVVYHLIEKEGDN